MRGICDGRVVIVTGAGRGIGREHALEFARQGARVVVNDLGTGREGDGRSSGPALEVVEEIRDLGGRAVASNDDVTRWDGAARLVKTALSAFGRLDVLVNNAGIVRDRMLVSMTEQEWDDVIRVHLKGHFLPLRHAGAHWRERSEAGEPVDARVINTSAGAGLSGGVGQGNLSAATAGVLALGQVAAAELGPYGVTVNTIVPAARTRMTGETHDALAAGPGSGFDAAHPANIAPLVVWLGSAGSRHVTGRVFEVEGGAVSLADGWRHGPRADRGARWDPADIGDAVGKLLVDAPDPEPVRGS
ncbi:SDR family oxidoreductase [Streptosporangium sp. NPDC048865]|uniref:SDR family oxidoreductase n=1 Tax=Streptosporangium sp. NPDC048865 TaxID=3155766 RepID=UPI00343310A7